MSHRRLGSPRPRAAFPIHLRVGGALLAFGAPLLAAAPAQAVAPLQGTSSLGWSEFVGGYFSAHAVGDIDGDGMDDLAFATGTTVKLVFGTKTGVDARDLDHAGPSGLYRLQVPAESVITNVEAAGDFDGDGRDDMVVSTTEKVYVFYGSATPLEGIGPLVGSGRVTTISAAKSLPTFAAAPQGITVGDFDGDGRDDLVVGRKEGGLAIVYGGPRTGSIDANGKNSRTSLITSTQDCTWLYNVIPTCGWRLAEGAAAGDFNGDGRDDLVVDSRNATPDGKRWLVFGRTGTFSTPAASPTNAMALPRPVYDGTMPTGYTTFPQRVGDLDGDGRDDLGVGAWTLPGGVQGSRYVLGTSIPPSTLNVATAPSIDVAGGFSGLAAGDQDGDGRREIAVLGSPASGDRRSEGELRLVPVPRGAGVVDAAAGTVVPGLPTVGFVGSSLTDFDGDGLVDLLLVRDEHDRYPGSYDGLRYRIATHGTDVVPPNLTAAEITPRKFRISEGADFSVTAEESATTLEISYLRSGGLAQVAAERRVVQRGVNTVRFTASPGGTKLPVGTYYARTTPIDAAGNRGPEQWAGFEVLSEPGEEPIVWPATMSALKLSGDAGLGGFDQVSLTSSAPSSRGTAVYAPKRDWNGKTIEFEARLREGAGGGEGLTMAFITAEPDATGSFLGAGGQQLGYGGLRGFALALDVNRGEKDPSDNFIGWSLGTSGTGMLWLETADPGVSLRSGDWVTVKVVLAGGRSQVHVDGVLRMDRVMSLPKATRLAFTAAGGASAGQVHEVRGLKID